MFQEYGGHIALSPDATRIAYNATIGGHPPQLFMRTLDAAEVQPLANTVNAAYPFFSPDGKWLGFAADHKLKKLSLEDGTVQVIADVAGDVYDADWGPDGDILFGERPDGRIAAIKRVSSDGGPVTVITHPDQSQGETTHFAPQRLPGTATLIYSVRTASSRGLVFSVVAQPLDGGGPHVVLPGAVRARYLGGGTLMVQTGQTLATVALDTGSLKVGRVRTTVLDGVLLQTGSGATWSAARDVIVYRPALASGRRLVWVDRSGRSEPTAAPARAYKGITLSPHDDRVAAAVDDGLGTVTASIYDFTRDVLWRVTPEGLSTNSVVWIADGTRLLFGHRTGPTGPYGLYTQRVDRAEGPSLLLTSDAVIVPTAHTPDDRTIVFMKSLPDPDIWGLETWGDRRTYPLVQSPVVEHGGRLSPDGRWLAYFSNATDRPELYVTPFAGGPRWAISSGGAAEAVWAKDGRELFFRHSYQLFSVKVRPGTTFDWDPPRLLFEGSYVRGVTGIPDYDVAADGRFLMMQDLALGTARLDVVQGWRR